MIGSKLPKLKTAFYESHFRHCGFDNLFQCHRTIFCPLPGLWINSRRTTVKLFFIYKSSSIFSKYV